MTTHLLAIGVNRSRVDPNIRPLDFAEADARAFHRFCAEELGYGDNAVLLADAPSFLTHVRAAVDAIGRRVAAGDTFVLYFSGHGYVVNGEAYGLLSHAELGPLEAGRTDSNDLLSISWLRARVRDAWPRGVHFACIMDACRTEIKVGTKGGASMAAWRRELEGFAAKGDFLMRRERPGAATRQPDEPEVGEVELYACPLGEQSLEFAPIGRGLVSYALEHWLREGLQQRLPRVLDERLADVLANGVDRLAREHHALYQPKQRPVIQRHGAPVVLFDPRGRGDAARLTRSQQQVVDEFDAQLAAGELDEPVGRCARDTLSRLYGLGLPSALLKELAERLQDARERARAAADADHDAGLVKQATQLGNEAAWSAVAIQARLAATRDLALQRVDELRKAASQKPPSPHTPPAAPAPAPTPAAAPTATKTTPSTHAAPAAQPRAGVANPPSGTGERSKAAPSADFFKTPRKAGLLWGGGVAVLAAAGAAAWLASTRPQTSPSGTPAAAVSPVPASAALAAPATDLPLLDGLDAGKMQALQREQAGKLGRPVAFRDAMKGGGTGPEMLVVPGGRFTIGSPDEERRRYVAAGAKQEWADWEKPRSGVVVPAFAVGRHEVTRGEFAAFVKASGHQVEPGCWHWEGEWKNDPKRSWLQPGFEQTDTHPVVCVSWHDATAYAKWMSDQTGQRYRLPSEAEWELAARAGTTTRRWWGDDPRDQEACKFENTADKDQGEKLNRSGVADCRDGAVYTAPVGGKLSNALGLYDVLGNASEWVQDCFDESHASIPALGAARAQCADTRRVVRGGSWNFNPRLLRSASRYRDAPVIRNFDIGFRLARTF